jgi:hypothetical protein
MAHFAKVLDGVVIDCIRADQEFIDSYVDNSPGKWIETFRGANSSPDKRYNFGSPDCTYNKSEDAFIPPQPFPSWVLNETIYDWEAPTAKPDDGKEYWWNEETTNWKER